MSTIRTEKKNIECADTQLTASSIGPYGITVYPFGNFVLVLSCFVVTVVSVRLVDMWLSSYFRFSLRVTPCGQTSECPLPTSLLCVKHPNRVWLLIWLIIPILVFYLPSFQKRILALLMQRSDPSEPRRPSRCGDDAGLVSDGVPHCLLLSRIALQSSDQDRSRLWEGPTERCLLWQAVNRTCSHAGLGSTPDQGTC